MLFQLLLCAAKLIAAPCHGLAPPPLSMASAGRAALDKLRSLRSLRSPLRRVRAAVAPFTLPWYEDGLQFNCTGCGKCCRVDGDVWLAPEEVERIMQHLGHDAGNVTAVAEFRKRFVRAEVSPSSDGGVEDDVSQSWMCLRRVEGACTFLDPLGKCSIYDVRPVQCSTYPFWPSLLANREAWEEEAVFPDDVDIADGTNERHWSPELGGCEGILSKQNAGRETRSTADENEGDGFTIVDRKEIASKMKAARRHWKRFPVQEIKETTWYL